MSQGATTSPSAQHANVAPVRARRSRLSPMEALERGFALFRSTFARDAWRYYIGAAPFVACFIPIWVINGQIRLSEATLLLEVTLLAGGYLLRVGMIDSYMQHVRERAYGTPITKPSGIAARAAALGRLLTWKIILSVGVLGALTTVAGAPWLYSACQFASLEAKDASERHSLKGCLALASQWFGGSLVLFFMLFPLWISVWLNGVILAFLVPQLLHSMFGVNTLLSTEMGIFSLIRSSAFWLSLIAGAWLALDPVVKCTFVVVYQHLRSRREGDDLRGLLAGLPREQQKKAEKMSSVAVRRVLSSAIFVLAMILGGASLPVTAHAAEVPATQSTVQMPGGSDREVQVQKLRQALNQESQRSAYRWHDAEHPSPPTWFDKLLSKIGRGLERAWNAVQRFLKRFWPKGLNLSLGNGKVSGWQLKNLRLWLILIAILTIVTGALLLWRRQRRKVKPVSVALEVAALPDLSDDVVASERSEDEWFALASQLEKQGELRLALRAAYLGLLAGLAQREWLTIRRDRTNREYLNEFTRRWCRRPQAAVEARAEVPEKLRGSLRQFDRVWYGAHAVTAESVIAYHQNQQEFLSHV